MPRKESLAAIVPNRYYDLQATVKYLHHTEKGTTAIIEQDEVQKKIMVPPRTLDLEEGVQYHFPKCFYSRNGWLKVKDTTAVEKIQRGRPDENVTLSLEEINQRRHELFNNYATTVLQVISISAPEKKQKNGNELTLTLVRGFAQNALVDVTIWNKEIPQEYIGALVNFQGFRVKMLTNNTFVLVSTVFSKLSVVQEIVNVQKYHTEKLYPSFSQVYSERTVEQMRQTLKDLTKCFSIVEAKITDATVFDYEGCKVCHKKMESPVCSHCGVETDKATFWVCQLEVEDNTDSCTLYVFNSKEQEMLHHAKKGSMIKAKIRSTIRLDSTGDNNIESHTLVGIVSIQF